MAPVIQVKTEPRGDARSKRPGERRSELICRIKYCNTLPDIPFDPKFITYPFDSNRFVQYKPTSLEKSYKHDLLTEHDLGVQIDLIDPDTYAIPQNYRNGEIDNKLPIEDERLLEEETTTPTDSKRSRHHNKVVPWLKKTEYISTEFNRYGASSEKNETKIGYKKHQRDEPTYMDRESQIAAINKTFEDTKRPIHEHYTKRGVTPVEILPVYPDFELWKYPFAQVQFDADPAPLSQIEEMSQAMIRGVMDESGEQFVAYFLPNEETLAKRKRDEENQVEYQLEDEYEYKMAREYNWIVKNKLSKGYEENYFFVFRDNQVSYNELETRVRLSKRRAKGSTYANNSKLIIKHRALNDQEFKTQELRLRLLQPPADEEEEEKQVEPKANENEITKDEEIKEEIKTEKPEKEIENAESNTKNNKRKSSSSSSGSESSSRSSSSGSESSASESEDEAEAERKRKAKADEEEIFGSASDSD